MYTRTLRILLLFLLGVSLGGLCQAQEPRRPNGDGLRIDYVKYRAARWASDKIEEWETDRENRGGVVCVYVTNTSDQTEQLRGWRLNGRGAGYYRQGWHTAWDRVQTTLDDSDPRKIGPGDMGVIEICGITEDFAPGQPFRFMQSLGRRGMRDAVDTALSEDPVQISFIRVARDMKMVEVHFRNLGQDKAQLRGLTVNGKAPASLDWVTDKLDAMGNGIARASLTEALPPGVLLVAGLQLRVKGEERTVYAHRRAFPDYYPIGTWGADGYTREAVRAMHIDTIVQGGHSADAFYTDEAGRYGFRTMVHTGVVPQVDVLRDLGGHPAVAAWMVQDEPDSDRTPQQMALSVEATHAYDSRKPTMITLCRMHKFHEYAGLPDIPGQDHYSVTAPSASRWPTRYGTRLEETAWYTEELKWASEPKPIWVWTQGLFDWDERPKRGVPTPDELAAQLLFNMGRGAKGILWFTIKHSAGERYPELWDDITGWGRVMEITRDGLLSAEPLASEIDAPDKIDVAALVAWDRIFLFVVNLDYEIHDEAYPWTPAEDVEVTLDLPEWLKPASAVALGKDGVAKVSFETRRGRARVRLDTLNVGALIVLGNDTDLPAQYEKAYGDAVAMERRAY